MLPADLIEPKGELSPELFPEETLVQFTARVSTYLLDAVARVEARSVADDDAADEATRMWVHYRTYGAAYRAMLVTPASMSKTDEGSKSTLAMQIQSTKQLADTALARFETLTTATPATDTTRAYQPSRVVHNVIAW
jgi:hypothetical protein